MQEEEKKGGLCTIEGHLNTPIINDEVKFLSENDTFFCRRHTYIKKLLITQFNDPDSFENLTNQCPWKLLEDTIRDTVIFQSPMEHTNHRSLTQLMENALLNLQIHHEAYYGGSFNLDKINNGVREIINNKHLQNNYNDKCKVEEIKTLITNTEHRLGEFVRVSEDIWIEKEISIIKNNRKGNYVLYPTSMVICVLDNIQVRFHLSLNILLKEKMEDIPHIFEYYLELDRHIRYLREKYKQNFFPIMKDWDALVIGWTVSNQEDDMGFDHLLQGIKEDWSKFMDRPDIENTVALMTCWRFSHQDDLDTKLSFYFVNLCKNYGHPVLSAKDGIKQLRENSKKEINVDDNLARKVLWKFRETYTYSFIKKRNRCPDLSYVTNINPTLKSCLDENRLPTKDEERKISLKDWENVQLKKNHEISTEIDEKELLKDTACAPPREEWYIPYDECAFRILHNQRKPRSSGTYEPRVLARYLKGDEGELARKMIEQENLFYNHLRDDIVQLCRKERELGILGRVFCKQTYEMRLLQVCLEKSLSDNILPFIREQTMTNTELEVIKRMDKVASSLSSSGNYNINLDLSKWNQLQRHDLNKYLFAELDNLHGTKNLYSDSHLWFNRCMVLLSSRLTPPEIGPNGEPLEGDFCHYDQLGGFEGMRQKAWTVSTIMIIKLALEECQITGETMGQGDNQVIHIKLDETQKLNPERHVKLLLNTLDYLFERAGLKLKLQETWYSKNLFEYSKIRYYKSIRLDDSLKRLNRLIPDINEGFPSLASYLTSASTTTENMARNYLSPQIPFIHYSLELGNILMRKGVCDKEDKITLPALSNIPSVFGGLPISNLFQHAQRGCPDPLTIWLKIWLIIKNKYPDVYRALLHLLPCKVKTEMDPISLVEDIYGLNIVKLPNFEKEARTVIEEFLPKYITNPQVTQYLGADRADLYELCDKLTTMRPYIANLAHEILRNSNEGIQLQLIGSFTNVQTINRLINMDEEREATIYSLGKEKDNEAIKILKERAKLCKLPIRSPHIVDTVLEEEECTYQMANRLRETTWGFPIEGVTSPVASEQMTIIGYDSLPDKLQSDCILVKLSHDLVSQGEKALRIRGPYSPYLGSSTPEKMMKPKLTVINSNPLTKSVMKLYYLQSYLERMDPQSNLIPLLSKLIEQKLLLLPPIFRERPLEEWCGRNYGGSYEHRFKASSQKRSALYSLSTNLATHMSINTNQLGRALRGQEDYNLFFQEIFLFIQNYITELVLSGYSIVSTYGVPLGCSKCTHLIEKRKINLYGGQDYIQRSIPTTKGSELIDNQKFNTIRNSLYGMSVAIGRKLGKIQSTDLSIHDEKESLGIYQDEDSSERLSSNLMTEFRSCNFNGLMVGMIQSNRQFFDYLMGHSDTYPISMLEHLAYLLLNGDRLKEITKMLNISITKHSTGTQTFGLITPLVRGLKEFFMKNKNLFLQACALTIFTSDLYSTQAYYWRVFFLKTLTELKEQNVSRYYGIRAIPINYPQQENNEWLKMAKIKIRNGCLIKFNYIEELAIMYWREYKGEYGEYLTPNCPIDRHVVVDNIDENNFGSPRLRPYVENEPFLFSEKVVRDFGKQRSPLWTKYIHHLFRTVGKISSSASKFLYCLSLMGLTEVADESLIVTLAEGSGGILHSLLHVFPGTQALFNTLQNDKVEIKQNFLNIMPPAIIGDLCNLESRIKFLEKLCLGETDITKDDFVEKFKEVLEYLGKKISIFSMDAELMTDMDNLDKLNIYLPIFEKYMDSRSIFVNKMFIKSPNQVNNIIALVDSYSLKVTFIKPPGSHPHNQEVYIVCYRGGFPDLPIFQGETTIFEWRINNDDTREILSIKEYRQGYLRHLVSKSFSGPLAHLADSRCISLLEPPYSLHNISQSFTHIIHQKNLISSLFSVERRCKLMEEELGVYYPTKFTPKEVIVSLLVLSISLSQCNGLDDMSLLLDTLSSVKVTCDIVHNRHIRLALCSIFTPLDEGITVVGLIGERMKDLLRIIPRKSFTPPPVSLLPESDFIKKKDINKALYTLRENLRSLTKDKIDRYYMFYEVVTE